MKDLKRTSFYAARLESLQHMNSKKKEGNHSLYTDTNQDN